MRKALFTAILAAALAGAASGATAKHASYSTKPEPPIDAGSDLPNPVYSGVEIPYSTKPLPPIDAGSDLPNPVYLPKPHAPAATARPSGGFTWIHAALATALATFAALGVAGVLAVRKREAMTHLFR